MQNNLDLSLSHYVFSNGISNCQEIMESNIILVNLDNIKHSVETYDEIFYAYLHNKPIIGFFEHISTNEKGLKSFIHPWKYIQIDRIETGYNALTNACDYIKNYYGEEGGL